MQCIVFACMHTSEHVSSLKHEACQYNASQPILHHYRTKTFNTFITFLTFSILNIRGGGIERERMQMRSARTEKIMSQQQCAGIVNFVSVLRVNNFVVLNQIGTRCSQATDAPNYSICPRHVLSDPYLLTSIIGAKLYMQVNIAVSCVQVKYIWRCA